MAAQTIIVAAVCEVRQVRPAPAQLHRQGLRKFIVHPEQNLIAMQQVPQPVVNAAHRASQVSPHLSFVRQAPGRFHRVWIIASLPQRAVIHAREAQPRADAKKRSEPV